MTPQILSACTGARIDRAQTFLPFVLSAMEEFAIDSPARQAAFLAQIGHESGGLHWMVEIWGPTADQRLYEPPSDKATELGNVKPGDGVRFLGRCPIQITGRGNYRKCGAGLGIDLETFPQLLGEPGPGCRAAGWYWASHNLNQFVDSGDFKTLTKRINGGTTGLDERMRLWAAAKTALGVRPGFSPTGSSAAQPSKATS